MQPNISVQRSFDQILSAFRWQIPERFNVADAICTRHARATPDAPALIFVDHDGRARTTTFGELETLSCRLANALAALGAGPGTIVGANLPQGPEIILAHVAVTRLGGIILPLTVLFGPDALRYRLEDSGARILITTQEGFERSEPALAGLPELQHVLVVREDRQGKPAAGSDTSDFWKVLEKGASTRPVFDTAADDPAVLLYTSGTTGHPKGVLHAHAMPIAATTSMSYVHDLFPKTGDRMWTPADWAWAGGLNTMWTALFHGRAVVAARAAKFDPERAVDLIATHGVRNAFIPPTALRFMRALPLDDIRRRCPMRSLMSGGEALGSDMIAWGQDAFGVTISEGFGLSEAFIPIGNCPSLFPVRSGSMGRALPGHEIAVLDEAGRPLPDGERGELALKRPNPLLFRTYWRQPEATAAKFKGDWCLFGDVATRDTDGYIWFHGRNDDVIKSSGYRIGPQEVEDCLVQHPAVRLAGVVGTPDPQRGAVVTAFLVLRDGVTASDQLAAEIQTFVRHQLSAHEYPRKIRFIAEMPLTMSGKIRRLDLRDMEKVAAAVNGPATE